MTDINRMFKTKDLAEASYILTKGNILKEIERVGKTCWFKFDNPETCTKLVQQYWMGESLVHAKHFYDAIQLLKNRIFANQN